MKPIDDDIVANLLLSEQYNLPIKRYKRQLYWRLFQLFVLAGLWIGGCLLFLYTYENDPSVSERKRLGTGLILVLFILYLIYRFSRAFLNVTLDLQANAFDIRKDILVKTGESYDYENEMAKIYLYVHFETGEVINLVSFSEDEYHHKSRRLRPHKEAIKKRCKSEIALPYEEANALYEKLSVVTRNTEVLIVKAKYTKLLVTIFLMEELNDKSS